MPVKRQPDPDRPGPAAPVPAIEAARILRCDERIAPPAAGGGFRRLYFGSEFCHFLLPPLGFVADCVEAARRNDIALTLTTPLACDASLRQIGKILPLLPPDSEVVCNDWGLAAMVRRQYPGLRLVAGRQLCKMIKDPRLPSPDWLELSPHGLSSRAFVALLRRLAMVALELDVPPFARPDFFSGLPLPAHVHLGVGYVAKGRICKIGSLAAPAQRRFVPGTACRRECLAYRETTWRSHPDASADLATFRDGNTLYYRHSPDMARAIDQAVRAGHIARLVWPSE